MLGLVKNVVLSSIHVAITIFFAHHNLQESTNHIFSKSPDRQLCMHGVNSNLLSKEWKLRKGKAVYNDTGKPRPIDLVIVIYPPWC